MWDTWLSAVRAALLKRILEEREHYLQKLRDIKQNCEDWELEYQQRKKMQKEARSRSRSPKREVERESKKKSQETVEEIFPDALYHSHAPITKD